MPRYLPVKCAPPARRRRIADAATVELCGLMEAAVAASFAVPLDELRAPTRRAPRVAFARQCAMYLAHVVLGLSHSTIGALFGRDRTTATHAARLVEERRDEPALDARLRGLEDLCGELMRGFDATPVSRAQELRP